MATTSVPAGYNVQPAVEPNEGVQGNFAKTMSNTISTFINRDNRNPLENRANRYELGMTGGAAQISDDLFISPVNVPMKRQKTGRKKPKKTKKKVVVGGGGVKKNKKKGKWKTKASRKVKKGGVRKKKASKPKKKKKRHSAFSQGIF